MTVDRVKLAARRDKLSFSEQWDWWDWVAPEDKEMAEVIEGLTEEFPEMQYFLRKIPEVHSNYLSVRYMNGQIRLYLVHFYMQSKMRKRVHAKIIRCFYVDQKVW